MASSPARKTAPLPRLGASAIVLLMLLMGLGLPVHGRTHRTSSKRHSIRIVSNRLVASRYSHRLLPQIDPAKDDITDYDDAVLRASAIEALGHRDGAVLAVDPNTGRILTAVNQKLVFSSGFIPCSTIK